MRGKRKRALRAEVTELLRRAPSKAGEWVPRYDGKGMQQLQKDEFRTYKSAWKKTKNSTQPR